MNLDAKIEFPVIEFRSSDLERGTNGWHQLCKKVREACETFGCFEVVYDTILTEVREEMFSPLPYHGWIGPCAQVSLLYEGFGIGDVSNFDSVKDFAQLMWPEGHPRFCYGLGEDSLKMNYTMSMRMMKYMAPPPGEYETGLFAHIDKPVSTIICEDQIPRLEIEVNDGQWMKLTNLSPSSFVFMVGDPLKAWSNKRLKSTNHKVKMSGDKNQFSIAAFIMPNEGTIIKTPKELIDEEHPQLFKDFDFMKFFFFAFSDPARRIDSGQLLYDFAALSPPVSNAHMDK
ncbi:hypothetical protein E1A91_D13G247200v1 [Gossypium mustelinum]|uniref:Isopenicillin N synthase-like Fe(2+) 2OG dioxygenase domain-containing protein n=1 Tax=Gossypium mustelinum TaxID=34275 RepID=A0A5D2S880_GOSMU|nr:hypothetical protein E1A91_D13G247200v1 [Gossypium mustelinum]